jgi:Uma2 family endonuclease
MSQSQVLNSLSPQPRPKVTYQEFLAGNWGTQHVEWVNGEVVMMAAVSDEHTHITRFLLTVLGIYVEARKLGAIMHEPFQMKTGPDLPSRSPDLMFVANANLPKLKNLYLAGPADLVVEVISPGTVGIDRGDKFYEYEQGGVKEYWLIDPLRKQAEFYQRGQDGIFRLLPVEGGIFRSQVLAGLWLKVEWLWDRPGVISVLKGWELI